MREHASTAPSSSRYGCSERKKEEDALRKGFYSYSFLVGCQLWMPPFITQVSEQHRCFMRRRWLLAALISGDLPQACQCNGDLQGDSGLH